MQISHRLNRVYWDMSRLNREQSNKTLHFCKEILMIFCNKYQSGYYYKSEYEKKYVVLGLLTPAGLK